MKILAIDPGFERLGVAILEKKLGLETLLYSACLQTKKIDTFEQRLFELGTDIEKIITDFGPEHLAIENLFMSNNQKTVMRVSEVRGAVIYISKKMGLNIYEYTPLQIKTALTGYGKSDKAQVAFMVKKLLKIEDVKRLDDELDAIACGLTHFAYFRS